MTTTTTTNTTPPPRTISGAADLFDVLREEDERRFTVVSTTPIAANDNPWFVAGNKVRLLKGDSRGRANRGSLGTLVAGQPFEILRIRKK